jgi:hypothetical protein
MSDRWYYAHDDNRIGPFSGRQLLDLAVEGEILRTDTIWKEGIEKGVLATRVQHLFPPARAKVPSVGPGVPPDPVPCSSRPTARTPSAVCLPATEAGALPLLSDSKPAIAGEASPPIDAPPADFPDDIRLLPETTAPVNSKRISSAPYMAPKQRAVGVKGAVIVAQDGKRVRFRKKCLDCGYEDSSWSTLPITLGPIRANFCCPKCLKKQGVEMRGLRA